MSTKNISTTLKEKIKNYNTKVSKQKFGKVVSVADGIAIISGLDEAKYGEILQFENGVEGIALNLDQDSIGAILFSGFESIKEGSEVKTTNRISEIGVGDSLIGRIIDPLGHAIDGKEKPVTKKARPIERVAPGVMTRESVNQSLETGILSIDSMIPIGKGQRELIIGDRKTGKTAIAIDTIINQKGKNVICVYVSIGQKNSTLASTVTKLRENDAMDYTVVVAANASESDALQYIAPFSAMAIAEEWMENGKDVLVIFDDLSKHAVAYRSVSLLLRRPPGREAYPGDVFYLHSRLLERAGRLNSKYGGGSITALPIIETQAGDISAYIPTNVISITDGQIFLMSDAFNNGQRPAVDAGLSVSRVGSSAQTKLIKKLSGSLKLTLANYNEVKSFAEFSSDLDAATKKTLSTGAKILELLKQPQYKPLQVFEQALLLFVIKHDLIEQVKLEKMQEFKKALLEEARHNSALKSLTDKLQQTKQMDDAQEKELLTLLQDAITKYKKSH